MNEIIAKALAARFADLQARGFLHTVAGLTKTIDTDAFTDGKSVGTMPVPVGFDSRGEDDWKLLLPDPNKAGILYFEDGGSTQKYVAGLEQVKSRLTLIHWFNGGLIKGVNRDRVIPILLNALCSVGRRIPSSEPGLSDLQLTTWNRGTTDPFAKYSAYKQLFNYRIAPYGYVTLDLTLTAYINLSCMVQGV